MAKMIFNGLDYLTYLSSGVVAMAIFSASFIAGVSVIWDKQFGFLKEILVAPASRSEAIIGRIIGDSIIAMLQGAIILALSFTIAHSLEISGIPQALAYGFVLAVGFTSLGIILALKISNIEAFQMIMSFLMMPLVFLSGAFYPIKFMPMWMKYVAYVNPLTYAVDGMRYYLTGVSSFNPLIDLVVLIILSIVFLVVAAKLFENATIE